MDALEFLRERKRMCISYEGCYGCPFAKRLCVISHVMPDEDFERIIATVEQWSKEHPHSYKEEDGCDDIDDNWRNCQREGWMQEVE
jgi:hypothetical protein|nr:MAG TPA: hypothetical protein [Caudoviricetes sp.]DAT87102.1 MAG TPA: hypothetical protein [Caudoviricetes sp.]